ncbi:MAG: hypothetical protein R3F43_23380 [bacterium]
MKSILSAGLVLSLAGLWACGDGVERRAQDGVEDAGPDARAPEPDAAVVEQSVQITTPADGAVIPAGFVNVEGTVAGPVRAVTVNDREAAVSGEPVHRPPAARSGSHELVARAARPDTASASRWTRRRPHRHHSPAGPPTWPRRRTDLEFTITDDAGLAEVLFDGDLSVDRASGRTSCWRGCPSRWAGTCCGWRPSTPPAAGQRARLGAAWRHRVRRRGAAALATHRTGGIDSLEAVALDFLARQDLASTSQPRLRGRPVQRRADRHHLPRAADPGVHAHGRPPAGAGPARGAGLDAGPHRPGRRGLPGRRRGRRHRGDRRHRATRVEDGQLILVRLGGSGFGLSTSSPGRRAPSNNPKRAGRSSRRSPGQIR